MFGLMKAAKEISKASLIFTSSVQAQIEVAGMQAENQDRLSKGESVAYVERDFLNIVEYMIDRERVINNPCQG